MIQLQVCFCLLGLALAALGVAMLLRPQRLRRFLRRLDARLWKWPCDTKDHIHRHLLSYPG